ncbi:hypothetical protein [Sphingomonas sp. SAFR-052]|uniref:hypothetical protein n=1 Tax=Sphingomonas sp. SAFR-052 TaxID=3436867 RepID=UPI003F81D9B0
MTDVTRHRRQLPLEQKLINVIAKVKLPSAGAAMDFDDAVEVARSIMSQLQSLSLDDDDARDILRDQIKQFGGLVKWANLNDIPISRVSEFNTGRRSASPAILVALGLQRVIAPLIHGSTDSETNPAA